MYDNSQLMTPFIVQCVCLRCQVVITSGQVVAWTNMVYLALVSLWLALNSVLHYTRDFGDVKFLAAIPQVDTIISVLSNSLYMTFVHQLLR